MNCESCQKPCVKNKWNQRFCSPACKQASMRARVKIEGLDLTGIEVRFWSMVKFDEEACWWWQGSTHRGYGRLIYKCQDLETHRVSFELTYGPVPPGLFVCHHCDNRRCVRPEHLFLGDIVDNTRDRDNKGRQAKGSTISAPFKSGLRKSIHDPVTGRLKGTTKCLVTP
jgi:hypothetical protein